MDVLIVDREVLEALELAAALEQAGFRVLGPAVGAHEALSLARGRAPRLALLAVRLVGDTDGPRLARALRDAHGSTCLFLTASPGLAMAGRDAAAGFIEKPCSPDVVVRAVRALAATAGGEPHPARPGGVHWFR